MQKPTNLLKQCIITAIITFFICSAVLIAFTWDSFPGGYIKNKLGLESNDRTVNANKSFDEFKSKTNIKTSGKPSILISKSKRTLTLYLDNEQVISTTIALGRSPTGHKVKEGDSRTPEGDYYVCTRNEKSQFHLFLGLSYPNENDAKAGFTKQLITRAQYDEIIAAIKSKNRPPWNTPLGGEIGIHGGGIDSDWTGGCIALENKDIELLWNLCPIGTPVRIEP